MSTRLTATQNKIRLISVFIFTVLLALSFYVYNGSHNPDRAIAGQAEMLDDALFMGLRHASPKEIRMSLPEISGKPAVLDFGSRLCHDCQRLAPVMAKVEPQFPQITFRKYDMLDDHDKYPAVFRAFKPVSAPVLVFINAKGEIRDVLYGYNPQPAVVESLQKILPGKKDPFPVTFHQKKI